MTMSKIKLKNPEEVFPEEVQRKIDQYVLAKVNLQREKDRLPKLKDQETALKNAVGYNYDELVTGYLNEATALIKQRKLEDANLEIKKTLETYVDSDIENSPVVKKKSKKNFSKEQKFSKYDLECMNFEFDSHQNIPLRFSEKLIVWFDRYLGGGVGIGNGHNCITCGSKNMQYFKREYKLKDTQWNLHEAVKLSKKNFI